MPKKKRRLSQKQQSARFIKKAREIGADESGKEFGRAISSVIAPKITQTPNSS